MRSYRFSTTALSSVRAWAVMVSRGIRQTYSRLQTSASGFSHELCLCPVALLRTEEICRSVHRRQRRGGEHSVQWPVLRGAVHEIPRGSKSVGTGLSGELLTWERGRKRESLAPSERYHCQAVPDEPRQPRPLEVAPASWRGQVRSSTAVHPGGDRRGRGAGQCLTLAGQEKAGHGKSSGNGGRGRGPHFHHCSKGDG